MTIARRLLINPDVSGTYHCISRCVRRAALCGEDHSHRRQWIRDRLQHLAAIFVIRVAAYAAMSNHLHVILRTDPQRARSLPAPEVARRWLALYRPCADPRELASAVQCLSGDEDRIALLRPRLDDLSYFMRCLKEPIARRANEEDECTGHFWEGRYKSQTLLHDSAVLACCVYVDLNPIRSGAARTLRQSVHTSIHERLRVHGSGPEEGSWLIPIERQCPHLDQTNTWHESCEHCASSGLFDFTLDQYVRLVHASARAARGVSNARLPDDLLPLLARLDIDPDRWMATMRVAPKTWGSAVGDMKHLAAEAARRKILSLRSGLDVYATDTPLRTPSG